MILKKYLFIGFLAMFSLVACNKQSSALKEINQLEKELLANIVNIDKAKAQNLIKKSQDFVSQYPTDTASARVLFKAADLAHGIGDYAQAMKMWHEIQENYATSKYAAESLFLEGFTYENDLQNSDKAKQCYLKFINNYPNHDLTNDVTMALKNIDIPLEELVKKFEQQNKAEIEASAK
jgi:outer membrane protein assembly factor BamD (BamD/ComL family)